VFNRVIVGCVALGLVGVFGFSALAWRPEIDPIVPAAPGSFAPDRSEMERRLPAVGIVRSALPSRDDRVSPVATPVER